MNHDERAPNSAPDLRLENYGLPTLATVGAEAPVIPSDRLYQLAAMTAGIFLLATLL